MLKLGAHLRELTLKKKKKVGGRVVGPLWALALGSWVCPRPVGWVSGVSDLPDFLKSQGTKQETPSFNSFSLSSLVPVTELSLGI